MRGDFASPQTPRSAGDLRYLLVEPALYDGQQLPACESVTARLDATPGIRREAEVDGYLVVALR